MAHVPLKNIIAEAAKASPQQFDDWQKAWRLAVAGGSQDSLVEFVAREAGLSEELFLQQLALVLKWPFVDMKKLSVPTEARNKISTKVAFQYFAIPTDYQDGTLQVAVSNPFDTGMLNSVQYDARTPVQFALAPKVEIDKALKKYYGGLKADEDSARYPRVSLVYHSRRKAPGRLSHGHSGPSE